MATAAGQPGPARRPAAGPGRPGSGRGASGRRDPGPSDPYATALGASGLPGEAALRRLGPRLGLRTVRDLLLWLPRRYDDLRQTWTLHDLRYAVPDGPVAVRARVVGLDRGRTLRRRTEVVTARLVDDTGTGEAQWYGRQFVERRLAAGQELVFSGKVRKRGHVLVLDNPSFSPPGTDALETGRIVPVYPLTAGLALRTMRRAIRAVLEGWPRYPEYLPEALRRAERLPAIGDALAAVHYPEDFASRDAALRRVALDELLALQVGMVARRRQRAAAAAVRVTIDPARDAAIREAITAAIGERLGRPAELTADQRAAMDDVRADLAGEHPMLRLLQGDVGSGKTAVAAYGLALAAAAGHQGALLAPTDLLARQHHVTVAGLLSRVGIPVELVTGSLTAREARATLGRLASGMAPVVVGTHALFSDRVAYHRLGLVVVDEQHRFGVEQRAALEARARDGAAHVLLMTATPIPRTLGQVIYADLDVSDLHAVPSGRIPIRTELRNSAALPSIRAWLGDAGERAFVVVPRIDETDAADPENVAGAEAEAERLRAALPGVAVGLVHGRLPPKARDETMRAFRDGELAILVGTTVIEVGVDVPAATAMVVLGADRFGLAQLHQLRGRVGRGTSRSVCVLVSDAIPEGAPARERLREADRAALPRGLQRLLAVAESADGFALAERDWELRREGDVLGLAQSGLPRLRVADLARPDHRALGVAARRHAEALVDGRGRLRGAAAPLRGELEHGWLAAVFAGEPAPGA